VLLCLKKETEMASEVLCFFKKSDDEQTPPKNKKKLLSVNVSHVLFMLFYLLTFEDRNDRLSQNISKELILQAA